MGTARKMELEGRADGTVLLNGKPLDPRLDVRDFARGRGFSWGYGGAGATQLSLAILCEYYRDEAKALELVHHFKWQTVADLPEGKPWTLCRRDLYVVLREIERDLAAREQYRAEAVQERLAATGASANV
jgi:hypothetical protein